MPAVRTLENGEIRLLRLPERPENPTVDLLYGLHFSLHNFKEDACPRYKALSYAREKAYDRWDWNDDDEFFTLPHDSYIKEHSDILIDGNNVTLEENLYEALTQFVLHGFKGWLWVDYLCINQSDSKEKTSQLLKMDEIFANAQEVLIWLGKETPHVRSTYIMVSEFPGLVANHIGDWRFDPLMPQSLDLDIQDLHSERLEDDENDFEDHILSFAMFCIVCRWFRRLWCTQEIMVAQDVRILFGKYITDLRAWSDTLTILRNLHMNYQLMYNFAKSTDFLASPLVPFIDSARQHEQCKSLFLSDTDDLEGSPEMDLCSLYVRVATVSTMQECSQEHDKIYAVLGSRNRRHDTQLGDILTVDYSRSVEELFTSFTKSVISATGCLNLLSLRGVYHTSPGLPSWVIDYRIKPRSPRKCLLWTRIDPRSRPFEAAKGLGHSKIHFNGSSLICHGVLFDEVDYVIPWQSTENVAPEDDNPEEDLVTVLKSAQDLKPLIDERSKFEVLWRTFILDNAVAHDPPVPAPDYLAGSFAMICAGPISHPYEWDNLERYENRSPGRARVVVKNLLDQLQLLWKSDRMNNLSPDPKSITEMADKLLERGWGTEGFQAEDMDRELINKMINTTYPFRRAIANMMTGSLFKTKHGCLGVGGDNTKAGDQLFLLSGAATPILLRPTNTLGEYNLVGDGFILDCMHGEVLERDPSLLERIQDIAIV